MDCHAQPSLFSASTRHSVDRRRLLRRFQRRFRERLARVGSTAPPETQLAETYPVQLSLPGSELISSDETLDQGAVRASAVWEIEAEISDVLDFFENALTTLGTQGEPSRLQLGSVGSLIYEGADNRPTYASVEVESTDDGLRTVTVSYLVNAEAASTSDVTESGEPEGGTPEADEPDEPDETGLPANADAASLLLGVADLPTRDWRASNSTFLEVDFSTAFFDATSCSAVTAALSQILQGSVTPADLASRTFSYDADLTLVRLSFAAAVFASPGDASVFFAAIEGVVEGGLRICFLDAIVEARVRAAAQGVQLETRFGEPGFVLLQSAALEAHAESTIALVDLAANLQLHVVQRGPTAAVFVSVVANDDDLLGAIPQILAEFDRRLGGSGEAAPAVASPPAPSGDYERALTNIVDDVERRLDDAGNEFVLAFVLRLDGVDLDDEGALNDSLADAFGDFVPGVISIVDVGLEALEELDPPNRFEEDHNRFIAGLREITRLQLEGFDRALEEGFDFETGFDALEAAADALEAELERELSAEFNALVASLFADEDDEDDLSLADLLGEENVTLRQDDSTITLGGELPDDFPEALILPGATLDSRLASEVDGVQTTITFWETEQEPADVLDFYKEALVEAGYAGEQERIDVPGFSSINVLGADGEPIVRIIATGESGTTTVIVSLVDS